MSISTSAAAPPTGRPRSSARPMFSDRAAAAAICSPPRRWRTRILHHLVLRPPVRTSALRGLGALPNVYAIESLMDELAARAGEDPVAYRLSILSEPRARKLIELVAKRADWSSRGPAGSGKGLGLAF